MPVMINGRGRELADTAPIPQEHLRAKGRLESTYQPARDHRTHMIHHQQHIVNSRERIEAKRVRAEQELKARLELRALQRTCKHDGGSKFIPDPSGNSDSYNECQLCGGDC